jgi:hypothetical protein
MRSNGIARRAITASIVPKSSCSLLSTTCRPCSKRSTRVTNAARVQIAVLCIQAKQIINVIGGLLGFGRRHAAGGTAAERDHVGEHGLSAAAARARHAFFGSGDALGTSVVRIVRDEKMAASCTALCEFTHSRMIRENRAIG